MRLNELLHNLPENTRLDCTLNLRATWNMSGCPKDATLAALTSAEASERIEMLGFEEREARQVGNVIEARNRISGEYIELFTTRGSY